MNSTARASHHTGDGDRADIVHLRGPAARVRQALAAHFLSGVPTIVEIGGYLNPISDHLVHDAETVIVVDPKIAAFEGVIRGGACAVSHIRAKYQAIDLSKLPRPYALVMLGYSMKGFGGRAAVDPALLDLLDGAQRVVIEWATELERATSPGPALLSRPALRQVCRIDFTLEDGVIDASPYASRTLVVLERRQTAS